MPIYEYRCDQCRNNFEELATSTTATVEISCPKCGSRKVKKTISAASFRINSGGSTIPSGALSGCSSKGGFS
jgi:putative FmdB family regulatory protein